LDPLRRLGVLALVGAVLVGGATISARSDSGAEKRTGYVLKPLVRRLAQPLYVATPRGTSSPLYVVERRGVVRVLSRGKIRPSAFLDIRSRVSRFGEQGLLSIAFHPDYAANGLVYAVYVGRDDAARVSEFRRVSSRLDPATERVLVRVPHDDSPYHYGGQSAFGPDGLLYVGIGDGGYLFEANPPIPDPHGNSQNLGVLLGKIFTLDVSRPAPVPNIVAYGLRNPWRFAFDQASGDLLIADVGYNEVEEVDVRPSTASLVNFGWSVYEGRRRRSTDVTLNPAGRLLGPVLTYRSHRHGNCSIIGGYLYRGSVLRLRGRYVFGDYCSGRIWSVRLTATSATGLRVEPHRVPRLDSFGEDASGELYAVSRQGTVYKFVRR
jgi:glucose/arabinose dehydrogenase